MQAKKSGQSEHSKLLLSEDSRRREGLIAFIFKAAAVLTILVTIGIIVSLLSETIGFFARPEVSLWKFLTGTRWQPLSSKPSPENFGILPLVGGTLLVAGVAALLAVPVGLGTAIFLSEYATEKLRKIIKPVLEILAGVPSVVYGFFAISFITPIIKTVFEGWLGLKVMYFNALSAGLVVGIMIIPMIASVSEDAMRAVPRSLREGAFALGATRFEVAIKVVTPAALSGIVAAFILAISRAIGETMAVSIAAGSTPNMTLNPLKSVQTLTAFIVQVSFGDAAAGSINSQSIYAVGMTLFVMTFVMNLISDLVLRKFREVYE
ncbi:MAG: phosphate ABC transporter permease subunit PstC [Chloroflexi bacterium]|nr:phosphate ABC transporter permease subunit PstC [Chloroflexota bacterium]